MADRLDTDSHTDTVLAVWLIDETLIVTLIQFLLCGWRDTDSHTDTVLAVWLIDETLIVTLIQFMLCC